MFGEANVHAIFGYGSFQEFGGKTGEVVSNSIRKFPAGDVPDFIVVGHSKEAAGHLADLWHFSPAKKRALVDHATYAQAGSREGFTYFNTDLWIPELGPRTFKVSLVDHNLFYAVEQKGRKVWAKTEYPGIRLKDASNQTLLWVNDRDGFKHRKRPEIMAQVEGIRATMLEMAYAALAPGVLSLRGWAGGRSPQFTGDDLISRFYRHSFRVESYRFWENGPGPMDKGKQLFYGKPAKGDKPAKPGRREVVRPVLLPAMQDFADRHPELKLSYEGNPITPYQLTVQNMYDVTFTQSSSGFRAALGNSRRFWAEVPGFAGLNWRGLTSYVKHGLHAEKMSVGFYKVSQAEYGGNKTRKMLGMKDAKSPDDVARWQRVLVGILVTPERNTSFWGQLLKPVKALARAVLPLGKVELDSTGFPVYYSTIMPIVNELHAKGVITEAQHRILTNWYISDPRLTTLHDKALLETLAPILNRTDDPDARGAAQAFLRALPRDLVEREVKIFINQYVVGE